jgi:hypothetical protein
VLADGTFCRVVEGCKEFRYSSTSGAGWEDDGDTILRPVGVDVSEPGRFFSTRASEHAATFSAFRAMKGLLGRAKHVHVESHTTFGDGGGGILDIKAVGAYVDNDCTIFVNGTSAGIRRIGDRTINLAWAGAQSGGTEHAAANTEAVSVALSILKDIGGGTLFVPEGEFHGLNTDNTAFLSVDFDNCRITGSGDRSRLIVDSDADVVIHVCSEPDLTKTAGSPIVDFELDHVSVEGTGTYHYYAMTHGRLVLLRNTSRASCHHNRIWGASMIGIGTEGNSPETDLSYNRVIDCKYTGLNTNGPCHGSAIIGNRISGTNGDVNSSAIQACGDTIVSGNRIYGDIASPGTSGGIQWGEGNFDGTGTISDNIISHVSYGIRASYHGPVNITNNTITNAMTIAGIIINANILPGLTVPESHCSIVNNTLTNCGSYQIWACGTGTMVVGNTCRYLSTPTDPSGPGLPSSTVVLKPQVGIRVDGEDISVVGNTIDGGWRGMQWSTANRAGSVSGNTVMNTTLARYSMTKPGGYYTLDIPDRETRHLGTKHVDFLVSSAIPTTGYYPVGTRWSPEEYVINTPAEAVVTFARADTINGTVSSGAKNIVIAGLANFETGVFTRLCIELDDATFLETYAVTCVGNTVTIANAIPTGKTAPNGGYVFINAWRVKPTIDADDIGGISAAISLTSDSSAEILSATITNLLPSRYYSATLGVRGVMWHASTPTNSGSIDYVTDISITTNSSGTATITILGSPESDRSRLPTAMTTANISVTASTGGFAVYATRSAGVSCSAKAKWWLTGLEDLGAV